MALSLITALSVSTFSFAGSTAKVNSDTENKTGPAHTPVSDTILAQQLIDYGTRTNDPMALLTAVKIQKSYENEPAKRKKDEKGGVDSSKKSSAVVTTESLLKQARTLAKGQPAILAMIDDVDAASSRGASDGTSEQVERVRARATDEYIIRFDGGSRAAVGVSGDRDTDLDLYIYDENGNLICSDTDRTDQLVCEWYPSWTGDFRVRIKNLGNVYNRYTLYVL